MTKVYACLLGNWVCLNDDPNCVISDRHGAYYWWEEGASVYASIRDEEKVDTFYHLDYVNIHYLGTDYRINPVFIQIVTEKPS